MAYADQSVSSRRVGALIIVAALHIALGYAFITGLAFNVIKKAASDLKTFDVQEDKPPPEAPPPPPPPPKDVAPPPPVYTPPAIVQAPVQTFTPIVQTPTPPAPVIHEQAPPAPPAKPSEAVGAKIKGDANFGITSEDYPPSAERNGEEGTTRFAFDIGVDGRISNCTIVTSSGFPDLDQTTCTLATRRARYKPAQDAAGNPIVTHQGRSIRWQIPKE